MLQEFPGGVWIDPDEIVGLEAVIGCDLTPVVWVHIRGGTKVVVVLPHSDHPDQTKPKAEAWIRKWLAERDRTKPAERIDLATHINRYFEERQLPEVAAHIRALTGVGMPITVTTGGTRKADELLKAAEAAGITE